MLISFDISQDSFIRLGGQACSLFKLTFSGSSSLGNAEEQAKDELRKAVAWSQVLLRQEHHTQDCGQKVSCIFCVDYHDHSNIINHEKVSRERES